MKKQFRAVITAVVLVICLATTGKAASADYNHDGVIDGTDLQQFITDFQSGVIDSDDLTGFAKLYGKTNLSASLVLMVAAGMDKMKMAWIRGSDGNTPEEMVKYDIHLSTTEDFIPGSSTLKKTVNGENQAEITGLTSGTIYYGKIVAIYTSGTSSHSNTLHARTYSFPVELDPTTVTFNATDLGLGKHTTDDGINYSYSGGTPPQVGSILFSEDIAGGMTIRTVESVSATGGTISVVTSDASLTDVVDRGSVYGSMKLVDFDGASGTLTPQDKEGMATLKTTTLNDGSLYKRIDWKEKLLCAEQMIYAHDEADFSVQPKGNSSIIKLGANQAVASEFEATVTAEFKPELITSAEWGGGIFKHLDAAKVAAKGTLTFEATAQYNFSAPNTYEKRFHLWDKTWTAFYQIPPGIPVHQEIILTVEVVATASASAEVEAIAQSTLTETVEVGAIYNGFSWTPYISRNEDTSLTATLTIQGKANGEIRLIPKIEVKFYKVISAGLSVEPFVKSGLTFEKTTNNSDFLAAHPTRLMQLTSFDASLGMEANIESDLSLGRDWEILPPTCVLGTNSCLHTFDELELFSIPTLKLTTMNVCEESAQLRLQVSNGTHNQFQSTSVNWEVFPDDGAIHPGTCISIGKITTCTATFTPGLEDEYTIFASGHGVLGELGRQFKELVINTEDHDIIPATMTITFQGNGSGQKECSGEWGYQRVTFNQEIAFEVEGVNPVKSGDIVTYDLSKKNGTIYFYGTAEDLFWGDKTTLNFDRLQTISIENTEGVFQYSTTSHDSEYIGFLIPHSATLPYSTSIEYFGWLGTVRNAVNMPQPWNFGIGCIHNVYDVPGNDDYEGCLSQ